MHGEFDIAQFLISKGASVNLLMQDRKGPLALACQYAKHKMVKLLVDNLADINVKDNIGKTPLIWAALKSKKRIDSIKYLVEHKAEINVNCQSRQSPLLCVSRADNIEGIKYLIDNKADINAQDDYPMTSLHWAALSSEGLQAIKYLVEHKADINLQDHINRTALFLAVFSDNFEAVQYLIEQGSDVAIKGENEDSVLDIALKNKSQKITKFLKAYPKIVTNLIIIGTNNNIYKDIANLVASYLVDPKMNFSNDKPGIKRKS